MGLIDASKVDNMVLQIEMFTKCDFKCNVVSFGLKKF